MTCMEHICIQQKCGWYAMDNKKHRYCPKCGGPIQSYFDEESNDHDRLDYKGEIE